PPELCPALTGVFQELLKDECHYTNGTEQVKFVQRLIYNRQEYAMFDSDVGLFVGFTPRGERDARYWNSQPEILEYRSTAVDWFCRHNYPIFSPFGTER
ncbi:HB2J protein, partial [Chloropsis hardwickii]|nr:HB2J protein [Chloropsis hardwickii]